MNKLECPKCGLKIKPINKSCRFNDNGTITISYCCDDGCDQEWDEEYELILVSKEMN